MNAAAAFQVVLEYKLANSESWEPVSLTLTEFFALEQGEEASFNSVPRHNHAVEYLKLDPRTVHMTRLTLRDDAQRAERIICETFWNNGQNRVIERNDRGPRQYWELILETKICESPPTWEILRLGRKDGNFTPWYHGFIRQNSDGSQTETKVNI